ncbi:MAG: IS66 family insertion sequence element accessory protein TnpB [Sphingobacterium sp.]|uniref:IS66 family insertion sequence element accessory protein TnpB n=1 Tax=Sphingobacterium sp. JB170 TaxID=1434842 RepID=UPI00097EA89A|nr:IS66 family insertion sequence element accessory protein TnpB [Sphingobacterium sp. JB170]SJN49027.1 Degenerate transposase [Sphingobacterium sp. JB170]
MLSLSAGFQYYLYRGVTDFRCGMDSLSGLVRRELAQDPLNGAIYIFFNRSRSQVKLLHFEGDGFSLYHKRLERGTFELPSGNPGEDLRISSDCLQLILQGIQLQSVRRRKRYALHSAC